MPKGRLMLDAPAAGAWNMAVDEALLDSAIQRGDATLRFYQWAPATLSLGYFQRAAEREGHAGSRAAPWVRRASGGGGIVHDRELTYSLALPLSHPLARYPDRVYDLAHDLLVAWLAQQGVRAERYWPTARESKQQPFLCFQRRARGDVVVGGAKIAGSAQRRRSGAVLQHGSILLARSAAAPELPGLAEIGARDVSPDALALELAPRFESALELSLTTASLSDAERESIARLADEKFGSPAWNAKR